MNKGSVKPFPDLQSEKSIQVKQMFDDIAGQYDFLNHFLSFRRDILWREQVIRILKRQAPGKMLDMATGTADMAIQAAEKLPETKITGVDVSEKMLEIGREKIRKKKLSDQILLIQGNGEKTIFQDNTFDAITIAFGIRNFSNPRSGLLEMYRLLKPGGMLLVLEFSTPLHFPFRQLFLFYFKYLLPVTGRLISGSRRAYRYLPESVMAFPQGRSFCKLLCETGFNSCKQKSLSGRIATIYTALK